MTSCRPLLQSNRLFWFELVAWWRYDNACAFDDTQGATKATVLDLGGAWINASDSHLLEEKRMLMALMDRLVNIVDLFLQHFNFLVRHFACDHVGFFHCGYLSPDQFGLSGPLRPFAAVHPHGNDKIVTISVSASVQMPEPRPDDVRTGVTARA